LLTLRTTDDGRPDKILNTAPTGLAKPSLVKLICKR